MLIATKAVPQIIMINPPWVGLSASHTILYLQLLLIFMFESIILLLLSIPVI